MTHVGWNHLLDWASYQSPLAPPAKLKSLTRKRLVLQRYLSMATDHCLRRGGAHAVSEHLRTTLVFAEVCRTTAAVMISGSPLYHRVCGVCAEICDACLTSCRNLDDMDDCIAACQRFKDRGEVMTAQ